MTDPAPSPSRPLWLRLWPLYLIAGGLIAAWALGLFDYLSLETLRQQQASLRAFVEDNLILAIAAYIGVYTATTVFMIPGALWITITGGFLFGLAGGTIVRIPGQSDGLHVRHAVHSRPALSGRQYPASHSWSKVSRLCGDNRARDHSRRYRVYLGGSRPGSDLCPR